MNLNPMEQALERLKAVFPNDIVAINFQIEHEPMSGFTLPCFMACVGYYRSATGSTPDKAVKKISKYYGITRVEEYIRTKAYEAKQVRA